MHAIRDRACTHEMWEGNMWDMHLAAIRDRACTHDMWEGICMWEGMCICGVGYVEGDTVNITALR